MSAHVNSGLNTTPSLSADNVVCFTAVQVWLSVMWRSGWLIITATSGLKELSVTRGTLLVCAIDRRPAVNAHKLLFSSDRWQTADVKRWLDIIVRRRLWLLAALWSRSLLWRRVQRHVVKYLLLRTTKSHGQRRMTVHFTMTQQFLILLTNTTTNHCMQQCNSQLHSTRYIYFADELSRQMHDQCKTLSLLNQSLADSNTTKHSTEVTML